MKDFFTENDCDCTGENSGDFRFPALSVEKANRLLRDKGKVVYSSSGHDNLANWYTKQDPSETHQALLICMEKIEKPDTAESLVEDIAKTVGYGYTDEQIADWRTRARRLIKGGGEVNE